VLVRYKFVGSVTVEERFAGAMMMIVTVRLNMTPLLQAPPPSRGGGVLQVMLPNAEFGLCLYWA